MGYTLGRTVLIVCADKTLLVSMVCHFYTDNRTQSQIYININTINTNANTQLNNIDAFGKLNIGVN